MIEIIVGALIQSFFMLVGMVWVYHQNNKKPKLSKKAKEVLWCLNKEKLYNITDYGFHTKEDILSELLINECIYKEIIYSQSPAQSIYITLIGKKFKKPFYRKLNKKLYNGIIANKEIKF